MRKFLAPAMAAVTFGGAVLAAATPADAERYRGGHYYSGRHHHGGGGDDVAIAAVAGIAGLALGAAIADGNRSHSSAYYSRGYPYRGGYRYDPRYDSYDGGYYGRDRMCVSRERVWDPYIGRHVRIERQYPC